MAGSDRKKCVVTADAAGPARRLRRLFTIVWAMAMASSALPSSAQRPGDADRVPLPPVIHECDSNCNTLTLVGDHYVVPPQAWEHPSGPVVWEIESFKRGLVALHRHFPVDSVFRGRVSADGNQLEQVSIDGRPAPVRFAWGAALDSVPGSNAERDNLARQARVTPAPAAPVTTTPNAGAAADPVADAVLLLQNGHCDEGIAALQHLSETDPGSAMGRIAAGLLQTAGCKPGAASAGTTPTQADGGANAPARQSLTLPGYVRHSAAADLAQKMGGGDCARAKDLQRLAQGGDREAQAWVGAMYFQAVCARADLAQGLLWTRRAAEAGSALGEYHLGVAYREGLGVAIDVPEATRWFRKSAEQHYPPAEGNLGIAYMAGMGVERDAVQGVRWLRASIEHDGPPNGADALGMAYLSGNGVARDEGEARKWFAAAAAQGYADAQVRIADMNCRGVGAPPNLPRCMMWLQVAAGGGNQVAAGMRGGLGAKMSPVQQMQADELVRQYTRQSVVQRVQSEMSDAQNAAGGKPAVITWSQLGEMMRRRSPSGFTLGEVLCASANVMTVNQADVDAKVRSGMSRDAALGEVIDANSDRAAHCLEH
jgi:TPR repeat protein